jgi:hypothetical protein
MYSTVNLRLYISLLYKLTNPSFSFLNDDNSGDIYLGVPYLKVRVISSGHYITKSEMPKSTNTKSFSSSL